MNALEEMASYCPYCGEPIRLLIDGSEPEQDYIEDCPVCCRPMQVRIRSDHGGELTLDLRSETE